MDCLTEDSGSSKWIDCHPVVSRHLEVELFLKSWLSFVQKDAKELIGICCTTRLGLLAEVSQEAPAAELSPLRGMKEKLV